LSDASHHAGRREVEPSWAPLKPAETGMMQQ
jgi:hypothetical protein